MGSAWRVGRGRIRSILTLPDSCRCRAWASGADRAAAAVLRSLRALVLPAGRFPAPPSISQAVRAAGAVHCVAGVEVVLNVTAAGLRRPLRGVLAAGRRG